MRPYARQSNGRAPAGIVQVAAVTVWRRLGATGRTRFWPTRSRPARYRIPPGWLLGVLLLQTIPSFAATLSVTVLLPDGKPIPGVVVTARPTNGTTRPAPPVEAIMDQINRAFEPDLLVVPVNSTVSFPNSDSVSHQIYSFSPAKRFQLPLYRGKPYPPVRFDQPGLVTLGCNIHDEMLAYVVVTDAPFSGRTAANGSWTVEAPSGPYQISIWHPRIRDEDRDLRGEITLTEAAAGALTLHLKKLLKPAPLEGRLHSWDTY